LYIWSLHHGDISQSDKRGFDVIGMCSGSPLIEVAMSLMADDQLIGLPACCEALIRSVISSFCFDGLSLDDCKLRLCPFLHGTGSLDRINAILHCSDAPLPLAPPSASRDLDRKRHPNVWTTAEDNRLLCAIHRFGMQSWAVVANFVGNNRTRSQCAQRWHRGLNPRLSKTGWSPVDDAKLVSLVAFHGLDGWTAISQQMGNRSDVQCRYHYIQLKRAGLLRIPRQCPAPPAKPPAICAPADRRPPNIAQPICPIEALIDWAQAAEEGTDLIPW
jgi:hypothetical protein